MTLSAHTPSHCSTRQCWKDSPDVAQKVEEVLLAMTLTEKVELVTGDLNHHFGFYNAAIHSVGIPALCMADGPPGIRIGNPEVNGGKSTALPAPIALAATWNTALAHAYGDVIGKEAKASGHNVFLGPAVDIARVPVGGRTFESSGEDPLLNARMAIAEVKAIQLNGVMACLKHYAVNNQEYARTTVNVVIDETPLREIYLRPFELVVKSTGVASFMGSFNQVNGTFACESKYLLNDILREEWGFKGWVMSDYGAVHSTIPSATAGLDQEQPSGSCYGETLQRAVEAGELPVATLDEMCRRILRTIVGLGLLHHEPSVGVIPTEAHRRTAQAIAEEAAVLLKNEGNFLPLQPKTLKRVLVIGCDADNAETAGGGSGKVHLAHEVSLLSGLQERLGADVIVDYAQGFDPISAADLLPGEPSVPSGFFRLEGEDTAGLYAQIWDNTDFIGDPAYEGVMPQIALNLGFFNFPGLGSASPKYPSLPFSVTGRTATRFSGRLCVPISGEYTFSLCLLGRAKLWIDDELVLDFAYQGASRTGGELGASGGSFIDDDFHALPEATDGRDAKAPHGKAIEAFDADIKTFTLKLSARAEGHRLRVEYLADAPTQRFLTGAQIRLGIHLGSEVTPHLMNEALQKVSGADVVVISARTFESEHMDRPSLALPNHQVTLIQRVSQLNKNTLVITQAGGAIESYPWLDGVRAHLHAWFAGQEQGAALARLLCGDVNPSGKLPLSFPRSDAEGLLVSPQQYPGYNGDVHYSEGLGVGYRGFDLQGRAPQYEFGFGLSYTQFEYKDLLMTEADGKIKLSFTLKNTGALSGAEVAQLYVGLPIPGRPPKSLVDWVKVFLKAGESRELVLTVDPHSLEQPLSIWSAGRWTRVRGRIQFYIGASSRDIRLEGSKEF